MYKWHKQLGEDMQTDLVSAQFQLVGEVQGHPDHIVQRALGISSLVLLRK